MTSIRTVKDLDRALADPPESVVEAMARLTGDIMLIGVAGKIGPGLARMAKIASDRAGVQRRVIGVARTRQLELEDAGVETIACDLLDGPLSELPKAQNILYLAGRKFGTEDDESLTWAVNTYLPGRVAELFPDSRIAAFSTGNVYPLTNVVSGGATERHPTNPVGEYAQSCLGRERIFEHASRSRGTPVLLLRLNYAVELRYGVLIDIARAVAESRPLDLATGCVNVIWQRDVNAIALRSLELAASPPRVLNVSGPETVSVRWLAEEFGRSLGIEPVFQGDEQPTALLSNAAESFGLFGYPSVALAELISWTSSWIRDGGDVLDKSTHFEVREGRF